MAATDFASFSAGELIPGGVLLKKSGKLARLANAKVPKSKDNGFSMVVSHSVGEAPFFRKGIGLNEGRAKCILFTISPSEPCVITLRGLTYAPARISVEVLNCYPEDLMQAEGDYVEI